MPPLTVMLKPVSGLCNLRCQYCFYADEVANRETACYGMMSEATLEEIVKRSLAHAEISCTFIYQGGEPTLAGLRFFQKAIEFENKWNVSQVTIHHSIQTNGMLLDHQWAGFLKEHNFLVGLSIDGNRRVHDTNRLDADGNGTFSRVLETLKMLKEYSVDFNVLTVVTRQFVPNTKQIYQFFSQIGVEYQQYIPCLDPLGQESGGQSYSLNEELYLKFLKDLFDCWYLEVQQGKIRYVRYFIGLMNLLSGNPPGACEMNGVCSRQYVVEADGSVYPCDFYMLDRWKLGNLTTDSFEMLENRRDELGFIETSRQYPQACHNCKWAFFCRGGCRRDRLEGPDGQLDINRYCGAFQSFFEYAMPRLNTLVRRYQR